MDRREPLPDECRYAYLWAHELLQPLAGGATLYPLTGSLEWRNEYLPLGTDIYSGRMNMNVSGRNPS
jgi:hypothetical protein